VRDVEPVPTIRVSVRFFALLREQAGVSEQSYEIPRGSTAADLLAHVATDWNGSAASRMASVAVNREYVPRDHVLRDGDEVALIPPVSGG